jgi:hypothetical protein
VSLDQVYDRSSAVGWDAVVRENGTPQKAAGDHPAEALSGPTTHSTAYPPTRPSSPRALALGIAHGIKSPFQGQSTEWNEDDPSADPRFESGQDGDYGTGVRRSHGYMGLSSAATLLRALQKFTPLNSEQPIESMVATGSTTSPAGFPANISTTSSRDTWEGTTLPPAREISPLVDIYFRYFRKSIIQTFFSVVQE